MSEWKITSSHRSRTAVIYVRQSTLLQLEHNRVHRPPVRPGLPGPQLGWPGSAVTVIDEDLGLVGSLGGRPGQGSP